MQACTLLHVTGVELRGARDPKMRAGSRADPPGAPLPLTLCTPAWRCLLILPCALSQQDNVDLGELMFSLCYLPTAGRLTITVIKARNLKAMDITGASGGTLTRAFSCDSLVGSYEVSGRVINTWTLGPNHLGVSLGSDGIAV